MEGGRFSLVILRQRGEGGENRFFFCPVEAKTLTGQKQKDTRIPACLKRIHHGKALSNTHVGGGQAKIISAIDSAAWI